MIAVQHIRIDWTKWERGAAPGAERNALPRQLPFQPPGDVAADWVHEVRYRSDARGDYACSETWIQRRLTSDDGLFVRTGSETAEVILAERYFGGNKLRRLNLKGLIARLPFGHRLIFRINGASDGDHQRLYAEDTFHIGFAATATLDLPLFREIDERELLY